TNKKSFSLTKKEAAYRPPPKKGDITGYRFFLLCYMSVFPKGRYFVGKLALFLFQDNQSTCCAEHCQACNACYSCVTGLGGSCAFARGSNCSGGSVVASFCCIVLSGVILVAVYKYQSA